MDEGALKVQMGDATDDALSKWAVYYWGGTHTGPQELGRLLLAQHDVAADSSCGTVTVLRVP